MPKQFPYDKHKWLLAQVEELVQTGQITHLAQHKVAREKLLKEISARLTEEGYTGTYDKNRLKAVIEKRVNNKIEMTQKGQEHNDELKGIPEDRLSFLQRNGISENRPTKRKLLGRFQSRAKARFQRDFFTENQSSTLDDNKAMNARWMQLLNSEEGSEDKKTFDTYVREAREWLACEVDRKYEELELKQDQRDLIKLTKTLWRDIENHMSEEDKNKYHFGIYVAERDPAVGSKVIHFDTSLGVAIGTTSACKDRIRGIFQQSSKELLGLADEKEKAREYRAKRKRAQKDGTKMEDLKEASKSAAEADKQDAAEDGNDKSSLPLTPIPQFPMSAQPLPQQNVGLMFPSPLTAQSAHAVQLLMQQLVSNSAAQLQGQMAAQTQGQMQLTPQQMQMQQLLQLQHMQQVQHQVQNLFGLFQGNQQPGLQAQHQLQLQQLGLFSPGAEADTAAVEAAAAAAAATTEEGEGEANEEETEEAEAMDEEESSATGGNACKDIDSDEPVARTAEHYDSDSCSSPSKKKRKVLGTIKPIVS